MINDINISIELLRGMPKLCSPLGNLTVGTMWDNGAQRLVFNRADDFKDFDMTLMLRPSRDDWYEVGLGTGNTYTISNALTQKEQLTLQVVFYKGGKYRCSSINTLRFLYASAPQNGAVPESITNDYNALLSAAVTDGSVVNGEHVFKNRNGTELFRLTSSAGKSVYDIAVANGFTGTESEWVASLKGNPGEKGEKGEPGIQGEKGEPGAPGVAGQNGAPGIDGKSAYEVAVFSGFTGSEKEWLTSLKGDKGDTGIKGEKGDKGDPGTQGIKGDKGDTGAQGLQGEKGANGADGYTPVRGVDYWTAADISIVKSEVNSIVEKAITAAIGDAY